MVDLTAFLSLERSMAAPVLRAWERVARNLVDQIEQLVAEGRWDDAHDLINHLSLLGLVDSQRSQLEEVAVAALLFGAQNLTGNVRSTSYVEGRKPVPYELQLALDQLTDIVEVNGAEAVRNQLHTYVRVREAKISDAKPMAPLPLLTFGAGKLLIDLAANLTTSRVVSLGFLSEAVEREVSRYMVSEVLDHRTCAICQHMHGRVFEVTREYSRIVEILSTQDPNQLRASAPWPKATRATIEQIRSMSDAELQMSGFGSPPYHPMCRGVLVPLGTVTEITTAELVA